MELAGIRTLLLAVTTKKLTFRSSRDVWIQRNISTAAKKKKKKNSFTGLLSLLSEDVLSTQGQCL